jgi:hypothetical protein
LRTNRMPPCSGWCVTRRGDAPRAPSGYASVHGYVDAYGWQSRAFPVSREFARLHAIRPTRRRRLIRRLVESPFQRPI